MAGSLTRTKPDLLVGCRSLAMVRSADSASLIMGTANKTQQEPTIVNVKQQRDKCFCHNFAPKTTFVNRNQQTPTLPLCSNEASGQQNTIFHAHSGYWNIKECVTSGPGCSYKFLLQTDL